MMAVRGAITVDANTTEAIRDGTCELLTTLAERNELSLHEIVSVFFSLTPDLNACFPAHAARTLMNWDVPMLDTVEIDVPGALPRCLRVLIHVRRDGAVRHAYLRDARSLRPELEETQ
jgi:chorismate mutase